MTVRRRAHPWVFPGSLRRGLAMLGLALPIVAGLAACSKQGYPRIVDVPPVPRPTVDDAGRTQEIDEISRERDALISDMEQIRTEQDSESQLYGSSQPGS